MLDLVSFVMVTPDLFPLPEKPPGKRWGVFQWLRAMRKSQGQVNGQPIPRSIRNATLLMGAVAVSLYFCAAVWLGSEADLDFYSALDTAYMSLCIAITVLASASALVFITSFSARRTMWTRALFNLGLVMFLYARALGIAVTS